MMIKIGAIWDQAVQVMRGRAGMLAGIALLTIVPSSVVGGAFANLVDPASPLHLLGGLLRLVDLVLLILGTLAITAIASDPSVGAGRAFRMAGGRLLPALGVFVMFGLLSAILFVPGIGALIASGAAYDSAGNLDLDHAATGTLALAGALMLAAVLAMLWLLARLAPLMAVVLHERAGALGAFRRSFALTRGSTMRLIGVLLLFFIVLTVFTVAVTSVVGVVVRLLPGVTDGMAVMLLALVSGIVSAIGTVVQSVFVARFYIVARDRAAVEAPTR